MENREIHVAPDRFEVTAGQALLTTELSSLTRSAPVQLT